MFLSYTSCQKYCTFRQDKDEPGCLLGSPQRPPPLEPQLHFPLWEESWSQNLTMTPSENMGNVSTDKSEKHSKDLSPCYQTRRRLWSVWTKACILIENWQHVLTTVHSHTSATQCYSFPFCSRAIKVILFPFPSWSRALIPFPIGLSCHNTHQTPHNWSEFETIERLSHRAADTEQLHIFSSLLTSLGTSCRNLTYVILHANLMQHNGVQIKVCCVRICTLPKSAYGASGGTNYGSRVSVLITTIFPFTNDKHICYICN